MILKYRFPNQDLTVQFLEEENKTSESYHNPTTQTNAIQAIISRFQQNDATSHGATVFQLHDLLEAIANNLTLQPTSLPVPALTTEEIAYLNALAKQKFLQAEQTMQKYLLPFLADPQTHTPQNLAFEELLKKPITIPEHALQKNLKKRQDKIHLIQKNIQTIEEKLLPKDKEKLINYFSSYIHIISQLDGLQMSVQQARIKADQQHLATITQQAQRFLNQFLEQQKQIHAGKKLTIKPINSQPQANLTADSLQRCLTYIDQLAQKNKPLEEAQRLITQKLFFKELLIQINQQSSAPFQPLEHFQITCASLHPVLEHIHQSKLLLPDTFYQALCEFLEATALENRSYSDANKEQQQHIVTQLVKTYQNLDYKKYHLADKRRHLIEVFFRSDDSATIDPQKLSIYQQQLQQAGHHDTIHQKE